MKHVDAQTFADSYGLLDDHARTEWFLQNLTGGYVMYRRQDNSSRQAWLDSYAQIIDETGPAWRGETFTTDPHDLVDFLTDWLR